MQPDELRSRLKRMAAVPGYQPLFLKDDITPDELAFIESHRAELPELDIINVHRRLYPRNGFMAHVIGYVGQVSEDMLQQPQWELYNPGDIGCMSGLEAYYNDILMGKNGSRQVLVATAAARKSALSATCPLFPASSSAPLSTSTFRSQPKKPSKASPAPSSPWIRAMAKFWPWSTVPPSIQRVRRQDHARRMESADYRPRQAATQQSDPGTARSRLRLQDHHGDSRPARGNRAGPHSELRWRQDVLWPLL